METTLDQRIKISRERIDEQKKRVPLAVVKSLAETNEPPIAAFDEWITGDPSQNLLVSLTKGGLVPSLNAIAVGDERTRGFVLEYFGEGSHGVDDLRRQVRNDTSAAVLHWDLFLDEYQIHEARALGADGFILNTAALDYAEIQYFIEIGRDYAMTPALMIADKGGLAKAMTSDAELLIFDGLPGLSALAAYNPAKTVSTPLVLAKRRGLIRVQSIPTTESLNELPIPTIGFVVPATAFNT